MSRHRLLLPLVLVAACLLCSACGKRVTEDGLYGVWLGQKPQSGRVLLTFIVKGRLEMQYPDGKDKATKVGKWSIRENKVFVEVEGEPKLEMTIDSVEQNGDDHDRLTDAKTGLWVAKV